jgi:hypothetical protein
MADRIGDRAVVLGGSVAGLFAARVPADFYREVAVVDRDRLIGVTGPRRAVPQGHHTHGLPARGQQIFEEFMSRLQVAATRDTDVSRAFMRVAGLVDPPTALMRMPMISRVLWSARNR